MGAERKYNWIILRATRGHFQVNRCQVFFVLKTCSDQNFVPMATLEHFGQKLSFPALDPLIPLTSNCFCFSFKILELMMTFDLEPMTFG